MCVCVCVPLCLGLKGYVFQIRLESGCQFVLCSLNLVMPKMHCSDITNTLIGISGETAPGGWNRPIYFVHSSAICPAVVLNCSWCVTPHSSPTKGGWPLQPILIILNMFTINKYQTGNRCIISKFYYFAGIYPASLPPTG